MTASSIRPNLWWSALIALGLSSPGCSLLVSFEQCSADGDCGSGQVCQDGLCERPAPCAKRADCAALGQDAYCLSSTCVVMSPGRCELSPEIAKSQDNVIPIGALMPLSGENADKGRGTIDGAVLAIEDINKAGGAQGTRFGLITCDTKYEPRVAAAEADYLHSLGVRAIIGGFSSSETLEIATTTTIPKDVLIISPASTSPAISGLPDRDLVWRTVASDALQAPAMGELIRQRGFQKIALISVDSAYGDGFRGKLIDYWTQTPGFEGLVADSERFRALRYPASGEIDTAAINASLFVGPTAFKPDAIVVIGSISAHKIIADLEAGGIAALPEAEKPTWVLSEALRERSLLMETAKYQGAWPRILGTVISQNTSGSYAQFKANYESRYTTRSLSNYPFADKAHDAAYLIALAYAAQGSPQGVSGADLARVLQRTISGPVVQLTQSGFNTAVSGLMGTGSVDLEGASGPLDFDIKTGDVFSSIGQWFIQVNMQDPNLATFRDGEVLIQAR